MLYLYEITNDFLLPEKNKTASSSQWGKAVLVNVICSASGLQVMSVNSGYLLDRQSH
jgi:hypothetical protein